MSIKTVSPEWRGGRWQVKITKPDGTRPWMDVGAGKIGEHDRDTAVAVATRMAEMIRTGHAVPSERDETVAKYFERWHKSRDGKIAPSSLKSDEADFRLHIGPELGPLPIRAVTSERLTDFVRHLDGRVTAGDFGAKTATNIWSSVRAMFRDASKNKDRSLRVLDVNPSAGVPAPDDDVDGDKQKQMLYPDEFLQLVGSEAVPLARRRLYAVALLTQARQAEIRALTWTDIDLAHRRLDVNKSAEDGGTKATKSKRVRDTTIETALVPLLVAMSEECGARGVLFPLMPRCDGESGLASTFRRDLMAAGVKRTSLHVPTATSLAIRFHDLRASGITWRLARGDFAAVVRDETGHADAEVQQIYVRKLRDLFGAALFPTLPESLLGKRPTSAQAPKRRPVLLRNLVGAEGLETPSDQRETPRKPADEREVPPSEAPTDDGTRDPDLALRDAIHAAIDAGLYERARALLDVLAKTSAPSDVIKMSERRR